MPRSAWLVPLTRPAAPARRLFCFPHAGGSASVFHRWGRALPGDMALVGVQPPGRAERMGERPLHRLEAWVEAIAAEMRGQDALPFAFLGHSLGALAAFEVARAQAAAGGAVPCLLVAAAAAAPDVARTTALHRLPDAALVEQLQALGGTPDEVWSVPELVALMLPLLRADLEVAETFQARAAAPLPTVVLALGGEDDVRAPRAAVERWVAHGASGSTAAFHSGGHFFLHEHVEAIAAAIAAHPAWSRRDRG